MNPSKLFRVTQILFWICMCVSLGGAIGLAMAAAPAIFGTARQLNVQIPNLPPAANGPNYFGGQTFGNTLSHFEPVENICIAIITIIVVLQTVVWLKRNSKLVVTRLVLLLPLIAATFLFAYVADQVRHASAGWVEALRQNSPQAGEARQTLDFWHAAAEKIDTGKILALLAIAAITAWGLPSKPS
jgi:hypothetical protein